MELTVIIPTLNGKDILKKSLPYLFKSIESIKNIKKISYEVIIIDNNSIDETCQFINDNYPKVKYIKLDRNKGFSGAVNYGASHARGKYIVILNTDCFVEKDTISKMIDFLKENKKYIATQPIVYTSNKTIENIGHLIDLFKLKGKPVKSINEIKKIRSLHKENTDIFKTKHFYTLVGVCLMIRKDVFIKRGMFDSSFHSYHEDIDLFMRLAKYGYKYYPTLTAKCTHLHMLTSSKMGSYKQRQDFKNLIRIIIKNYPLKYIIIYFPSLIIERMRNLSGLIKSVLK